MASRCFWGLGKRVDLTLNAIYKRDLDLCVCVCVFLLKKN